MSRNNSRIEDIEKLAALLQNEREYAVIFEFVKEHADALAFHMEIAQAFFTVIGNAPAAQAEEALDLCSKHAWRDHRLAGRAALRLLSRLQLTAKSHEAAAEIASGDFYSAPAILRILLRSARNMADPSDRARRIADAADSAIKPLNETMPGPMLISESSSHETAIFVHRGPAVVLKRWQLRRIKSRAEKLIPRPNSDHDVPLPDHDDLSERRRKNAEKQLKRAVKRRFDGPI